MLSVENLSARGLSPVSFELTAGGAIALQGPSGSGKSLFLRALADLDPSQGLVHLAGTERNAMSGPAWRRRVTYLATDAGWWANRVGGHFTDWTAVEADLDQLGLSAECQDWPVSRLSNGEKQRLALVRALAGNPEVLLLDEPTSALDSAATQTVEDLIQDRRQRGMVVIWVSHDERQGERVAERIFRIADGRVTLL